MKSVATIRQLMFRFTENNEGILNPVCFVIDFAPKKRKRGRYPFSKHIAFLLVAARFWMYSLA
jgi:hypothetical protein